MRVHLLRGNLRRHELVGGESRRRRAVGRFVFLCAVHCLRSVQSWFRCKRVVWQRPSTLLYRPPLLHRKKRAPKYTVGGRVRDKRFRPSYVAAPFSKVPSNIGDTTVVCVDLLEGELVRCAVFLSAIVEVVQP